MHQVHFNNFMRKLASKFILSILEKLPQVFWKLKVSPLPLILQAIRDSKHIFLKNGLSHMFYCLLTYKHFSVTVNFGWKFVLEKSFFFLNNNNTDFMK